MEDQKDPRDSSKPSEAIQSLMKHINDKHGTQYVYLRPLLGGFAGETCIVQNSVNNQPAVLKHNPRKDEANKVLKAAGVVAQARAAGWPTPEWFIYGVSPSGQAYTVQEYMPLASGSHWEISTDLADAVVELVQKTEAKVHLDTDVNWIDWDRAVVFDDSQQCAARLREHSKEGAEFVSSAEAFVAQFRNRNLAAEDIVHGDFQPGNFLLAKDDPARIEAVVDVEAIGKGTRFHDVADFACHNIIWQGPESTTLPILNACAREQAAPGEWEVSLVARMYELLCFYIFLFRGDASSRLRTAMSALEYVKENRQ